MDRSVSFIDRSGRSRIRQWYDPLSLPKVRRTDDDAYVEEANVLLGQAVENALRPARRPGILLSGGLDSAIVADEMLRQMSADKRLPSFTFAPLTNAPLSEPPGMFGDERAAVTAFAATHDRLDPHFAGEVDLHGNLDRHFLAADTGRPALAVSAIYDGPMRLAAEAGCDWLFDAGFGNASFSQDGRWAYTEFAKSGRWMELWRLARDHPGDMRPMWRRLLARSVLPPDARPCTLGGSRGGSRTDPVAQCSDIPSPARDARGTGS